jgi:ATP-dependent DNA helicase PIF1
MIQQEKYKILLDSFHAKKMKHNSINSILKLDDVVNYPVKFLDSLNPPGFPLHLLTLKIGTPIVFLRNLSPPKLCNETHLRINCLQKNLRGAEIMTGSAKGKSVFIPRIPMIPTDYPFQLKRMQFSVKLCFAMAINKSNNENCRDQYKRLFFT